MAGPQVSKSTYDYQVKRAAALRAPKGTTTTKTASYAPKRTSSRGGSGTSSRGGSRTTTQGGNIMAMQSGSIYDTNTNRGRIIKEKPQTSSRWAGGQDTWASGQAKASEPRPRVSPKTQEAQTLKPGQFSLDLKPFMEAMETTQQTATADKTSALAEIRKSKEASIGALDPFKQSISDFEGSQPMSDRQADMMMQESELGIQAGAQEEMRQLSESGAPGGFRQSQMKGIQSGMTGQLAQSRRDIELKKIGKETEHKGKVAELKGKYGQQVGAAEQRGGEALAQLYGQTIASTPKLSYPS